MLWILTAVTALGAPVDAVQPAITRAGFLRFSDQAFSSLDGLHQVRDRLDRSTDPAERAALTDWLTRLTLTHGTQLERDALLALAIHTPHAEVRLAVLERMVRAPGIEPLLRYADDPDPRARAATLRLLSTASATTQQGLLSAALDDVDPQVRLTALRGIRAHQIQVPDAVAARLTDTHPTVRLQAALCLRTLHPERFRRVQSELARDPDARVQALAR